MIYTSIILRILKHRLNDLVQLYSLRRHIFKISYNILETGSQ